jgi:hypothetical protein
MLEQLSAPFPPDAISWRVGSVSKDKTKAQALAYIDGRDVMRRLDEVCGPGGWQATYIPMPNNTMCCSIGIKVDGEWVWKANGAGNTDIEGEKGGYSDAFKRAAVLWGIGRYLYDIESPWVRIDEWKKIDKNETSRLRALLPAPNGAAKKPKAVARADGSWKQLAAGLDTLRSEDALDEYLKLQSALIAEMPAAWLESWTERVRTTRERLSQREAA